MKKITVDKLRETLQWVDKLGDELTNLRTSLSTAGDFEDKLMVADEFRTKEVELNKLLLDVSPLLFGRARRPAKDKPAAAPKAAKAARKPRTLKSKTSEDANITEAGIDSVYDALPGPTAKHEAPSAIAARLKMTTAATRAALDVLKKNDKAVRIGAAAGHWRKAKA